MLDANEAKSVIQNIRAVARLHGYAIGEHGSMKRDIDLMAMPWAANAVTPLELVGAIQDALPCALGKVEQKEHGRVGFSIFFDKVSYVDLSIMHPERKDTYACLRSESAPTHRSRLGTSESEEGAITKGALSGKAKDQETEDEGCQEGGQETVCEEGRREEVA